MKTFQVKIWGGTMLLTGALYLVPTPAQAGTITVFTDNFSTATISESQGPTLGADTNFGTINGTNVDVLGNNGSVPTGGAAGNLVPFEGICASSGSQNCVDLDGTATTGPQGNPQGQLESIGLVLSAGTYNLSYDLLGASGFLSTGTSGRNFTTSTTIEFGNASCISTGVGCVYLNSGLTLAASNTSAGNIAANALNVAAGGTYYIAFLSQSEAAETTLFGSQMVGALLDNVTLTETTPEPSTMILVGSALLGLGGFRRLRAARRR